MVQERHQDSGSNYHPGSYQGICRTAIRIRHSYDRLVQSDMINECGRSIRELSHHQNCFQKWWTEPNVWRGLLPLQAPSQKVIKWNWSEYTAWCLRKCLLNCSKMIVLKSNFNSLHWPSISQATVGCGIFLKCSFKIFGSSDSGLLFWVKSWNAHLQWNPAQVWHEIFTLYYTTLIKADALKETLKFQDSVGSRGEYSCRSSERRLVEH